MNTCDICGNQAKSQGLGPLDTKVSVSCYVCGEYILIDSFTIDENIDKLNFYKASSWIREQNYLFNNVPEINLEKFNSLIMMKDKKIQEKFDLMMLYLRTLPENIELQDSTSYMQTMSNLGATPDEDIIRYSNGILPISWMKDYTELLKFVQKAINNGLIEGKSHESLEVFEFSNLTFDGLEYIENLDEPNKASKNIFVAFNFEDSLKKVFGVYIKQAIEELGFNYVVVNQNTTEHDKAISDEIIAKLKSSRIVIADFTNHRNSVYFEAGFAMGMKIPIIWTCQEGHTEDLSFDTRQYPHLVWKDGEDLKEQIMNRIKVIL